MLSATSTRSDVAPRFSVPRLAAGALAGLVGGLAFGALMVLPAVTGAGLEDTGMMTLLSRLIGTDSLPILWGVHVLASAVFGLAFAAFVAPHEWRRTLPLALLWGALLWLVGAFLLLRVLTGEPLAFEVGLLYNLLGHLVYGAVLGSSYVALFREELGVLRDRDERRAHRAMPKP